MECYKADDEASFILSAQDDILSKKNKKIITKRGGPPTIARLTSDVRATSNKMQFQLRPLQLIGRMKDQPVSS